MKQENIYLPDGTCILTSSGLKPIEELTNEDSLLVIDTNNDVVESSHFIIDTIKEKTSSLFIDNDYSQLEYIGNLVLTSCADILEPIQTDNMTVSSFYIDKKWYDLPKDATMYLSLLISTCFNRTDYNTVIETNEATRKYLFRVLKQFNETYGIYFPYNKINRLYEFNTNLFKEPDEYHNILLNNLGLFKNIIFTMRSLKCNNYSYGTFFFRTYKLGALFQSFITLCDYESKLTFDRDKSIFKLTFVRSDKSTSAHKETIKTIGNNKDKFFRSITLTDCVGKIIVSQNNNKNTTVNIIKPVSVYYPE